jgi:hypothetical protein
VSVWTTFVLFNEHHLRRMLSSYLECYRCDDRPDPVRFFASGSCSVMLILIHDRRKIVRFDVTQHPSLAGKAEGTMKMSADEKSPRKPGSRALHR